MNDPSQLFADRDIKRVVHFHTDHFEPGPGAGLQCVETWLERSAKLAYAKNASLFYLSMLKFDGEFFVENKYTEEDRSILLLLDSSKVDLHVHIHHEPWTSGRYSGLSFNAERDGRRLDNYIGELLTYLSENHKTFNRRKWGFIHGKWALNGSDPDVCHIGNEIQILKKHGCVADFSFPAGRGYCDPAIKHPIDILPVDMVRSYDMPEADAKEISSKVRPGHFIVWNSEATFLNTSIEHVVEAPSSAAVVDAWLRKCPVIEGTLYIRTFCHTMNSEFWIRPNITNTPMLSKSVQNVFKCLEEACAKASCEVQYQNASEVIDAII